MEDNNQQQNIPHLCRKKCGFYGSPNFDGLCSKCHRSAQAQLSIQQADCMAPVLEARLSMTDVRKSPESPSESPLECESSTSVPGKESSSSAGDTSVQSPEPSSLESNEGKFIPSGSSSSSSQADLQADAEVAEAGLSTSPSDVNKTGDKQDSPVPLKSTRCHMCRKRVGPAAGYLCRCGSTFCSLHRYSDSHDCSFDYRKAGQDDIRRSNPQILCSKLPKI